MRSFNEMATLGSPNSSPSPNRRPKKWARKCERLCCQTITYFPLAFVYGLTSWAVWVEAGLGFLPSPTRWTGPITSLIGIILYILLNLSYTTAVFTDPGSTLAPHRGGYSHLPTQESGGFSALTVKSTGETRYCKKCQAKKPDRAHHCSTCRRCVLKMDHHCPWLATCVGLRNYKAFMLFLIYTTLFCWICFAVSATWVWAEITDDRGFEQSLMPVNYVLLSVLSGIIGLVLTGFTGWHIYLCCKGSTTIESLEKTRYLSPLRKQMQHQISERNYVGGDPSFGEQLREIHANALPGVTRPEEGEERSSPAQNSLRRNWGDIERQREYERYQEYQDERDSEKLPNAFDLGWKRNVLHVFGERKLLWFLPVCTTTGDGWLWETNPVWLQAREQQAREREASHRLQKERERAAGWNPHMASPMAASFPPNARDTPPREQSSGHHGVHGDATPLRTLNRAVGDSDTYETSSDEQDADEQRQQRQAGEQGSSNWNDLPEEMVAKGKRSSARYKKHGQRAARGTEEWSSWDPK